MKIRTDFVTNSSSSSFVVELEIELADASRYVFETQPTEEGANSNFSCTGGDIAGASSISELCDLLQKSMTGTGKTKIKTFVGEVKEAAESIEDIKTVTLRRIWVTMGESSGCTIMNDSELQKLAKKVVASKGAEKEAACREFEEYLRSAEVHAEGGWQDSWPTGFCKNAAVPTYKWEYLGVSSADLAKKIAAGKIDNNDLAVETVAVDMKQKTVEERAEFIIDSKEKGIEKKPACKSNKFYTGIIQSVCSGCEIREHVPITELLPDCEADCDALDYVVFRDQTDFFAVSIKTAANGKSKTFKAIAPVCDAAGIRYLLLDEKKDCTEEKVAVRLNEALFANTFQKYVAEESAAEEACPPECGDGYEIKVKFADGRSYVYKCVGDICVGDIVCVGGSKTGQRGMVTFINRPLTANQIEAATGLYAVEKIFKY